jgi:hypothetical protein
VTWFKANETDAGPWGLPLVTRRRGGGRWRRQIHGKGRSWGRVVPSSGPGAPLADAPPAPALEAFSDCFILVYLSTAAARSLLSPFDLLASTNTATVELVSLSTSSRYNLPARILLACTRSFLALPPMGTVMRTFSMALKGLHASPEISSQDSVVTRVAQPADGPLVIRVPVASPATRLPHPLVLLPLVGLTHEKNLP